MGHNLFKWGPKGEKRFAEDNGAGAQLTPRNANYSDYIRIFRLLEYI